MAKTHAQSGMIVGFCNNPNCDLALQKKPQRVPAVRPNCEDPECAGQIVAVRKPETTWPPIAAGVLLAAGVSAGAWWWWMHRGPPEPVCDAGTLARSDALVPDAALALADVCLGASDLNGTIRVLTGAKERGSGAAAVKLAQLYDPLTPNRPPFYPSPSIVTAVEFLRQACALSEASAAGEMAALRGEAQRAGEATNDRMLLDLAGNWPECTP